MSYNSQTKMWEGYVYIIRNDIYPEKYYVGITTTSATVRWLGHKTEAKSNKSTNKLHKAMANYGIEHFALDIIATYSKSTKKELIQLLKEMEIYYISKFNSFYGGYNSTLGGDKISTSEREVYQYDLDGNFIAKYKSIDSVKEYLNLDAVSSIYACCSANDNSKFAYGYIWKYANDITPCVELSEVEKIEAIHREKMKNEINKYDYTGKLVATYKNSEDVLLHNPNITRSQLYYSCIGKAVYADMYIYRFKGDSLTKYKTYNIKPKVVEQIDLNNNVIAVFPSCREAAKKFNTSPASISHSCMTGDINLTSGFRWRYPENYYNELKVI